VALVQGPPLGPTQKVRRISLSELVRFAQLRGLDHHDEVTLLQQIRRTALYLPRQTRSQRARLISLLPGCL